MKEQTLTALIDTLRQTRTLSDAELSRLYHERTPETDAYLYAQADAVRREVYGNAVYLRGLIEISNICKNDCLYCGIRRSNGAASRYRLTLEDLLACCEHGYALGFRTFVLQGGEDAFFTRGMGRRCAPAFSRLRDHPLLGRAQPRKLRPALPGWGASLPAAP